MARWTRPTLLRPDLCRWRQVDDDWEFGPPGCELVYTLDDELDEPEQRDASVRLVASHVAVHPDGSRRVWLGMRSEAAWLPHPETRYSPPWSGGTVEVLESRFCEHHGSAPAPERAVHDETRLLHGAVDFLGARLPVSAALLVASARFDADRDLHVVGLPVPPASKRELERDVADHLGHGRVRLP